MRAVAWRCLVVTAAAAVVVGLGAGCSGNAAAPTGGGGAPPPGGGGGTSFTITSTGVSPTRLTVPRGTQVRFVNNDTINHDMSSDPHPTHTDCVEINQVSFLTPGQSKETGALNTARTCGFHDHNQPSNNALRGEIVIQ